MEYLKIFLTGHATVFQIGLFLLVMTSLWTAEKILLDEKTRDKWSHSSVNALFIISALPIQLCLSAVIIMISNWVNIHHWGLTYLFPHPQSPWVKYILMFFILDLLDYFYHVIVHKVPVLWRFHLVHHTDLHVDVSTNVREHPGETFFRNCFLILWVFLSGASFGILFVRQFTQTISNISSHTSFRLSQRAARILGWVFITPNLHHVHHHFEHPYTDRNYGDVFSIWDRLFGTFIELPFNEIIFGLDTHMDKSSNSNYKNILAFPFV